MGTKTTKAPAAKYSAGTMVLGGTHGASAVKVQCVEVANYVFYREVDGTRWYEHCGRCDGSGHFDCYAGIAGGVCFECGGAGRKLVLNATEDAVREIVRKRLLAKAARERKAEREAEAARLGAAAWAEANAELAAGLAVTRERYSVAAAAAKAAEESGKDEHEAWAAIRAINGTLIEFAWKAERGPLTEKQTAFAASLLAEQAESDAREAAKAAAKAEKVAASQHLGAVDAKLTVTGTVKVATTVEVDSYSGYGTERKRLVIVEVDGSEVKFFSQAQWAWDAEKGQTLTLTGTVKRHGEYQGVKQTELGGRIKVG